MNDNLIERLRWLSKNRIRINDEMIVYLHDPPEDMPDNLIDEYNECGDIFDEAADKIEELQRQIDALKSGEK